jgi:Trk-type K+ transport system membrane component
MRRSALSLRCRWVLRALGQNPLVRASDRTEALAVLMVLVVMVLAIPFASQTSNNTYDARMRIIDEQLRTRHSVEAVVVGTTASVGRYSRPGPVRAEWREGDQVRSAMVSNATVVSPGAAVLVWLDNAGNVVSPPETPQVARSIAAARAWTLWVGIVGAAVLIAFASRRALDRHRARSWERELLVLAHNDDGWADRHS